MPRFADMVLQGIRARGHEVQVWMPTACFHRLPSPLRAKKWLGYLDQYVVFPLQVRLRLRKTEKSTLFVFADQALGPWVPLVADRPHVVHINDLIAVRSALGEFEQNPTSWTGRQYQSMIRRGFRKGQHFVSISKNTRADLHRFLPRSPRLSEVVYLGLNYPFRPMDRANCVRVLAEAGQDLAGSGCLLHVGHNSWSKNRLGVLEIYASYVKQSSAPLPLWLVGPPPTNAMKALSKRISTRGEVRFLTGLTNEQVCAAYSSARLLIYPSRAEGFGWPIAEAMACGCLVLTTDQAPMTEVGGDAAYYLPRRPDVDSGGWARTAADRIMQILALPAEEHAEQRRIGLARSGEFDADRALDAYERIYLRVLEGALD